MTGAAKGTAMGAATGAAMAAASGAAQGVVVTLACAPAHPDGHECVTRAGMARGLAALKGYEFAGEFDPAARYGGPVYFVPSDTLVGREHARALGIRDGGDLFGAVVPHAFVATKSITHALLDAAAQAPAGWSEAFAAAVRGVALRGYTAFAREDALRAGRALLAAGPVRIKRATGIGGGGQFVVEDPARLHDVVAALDASELASVGVVLEENLTDVLTYSVGRVEVAGLVATYCGTQGLTPNNHGAHVYGGSELFLVRGEFETLLAHDLAAPMREAVGQARRYDRAADAHFPGFVASRRNYDVATGIDAAGAPRAGVLEQSWRLGGASGAEIGALAMLQADPGVTALRARCVERYGDAVDPPRGATVYFDANDPRVGRLTKYTVVERHADAR